MINILLLTQKRLEYVRLQLEHLKMLGREVCLYVSIDGVDLDNEEDYRRNIAIRHLIHNSKIVVSAQVSEQRKGCRNGVVGGIDWFFSKVDSGIIIEDDCFIDLGYIRLMNRMLDEFKVNPRVFSISADSVNQSHNEQYCELGREMMQVDFVGMPFTRVWGWATWRNRWQVHMQQIKNTQLEGLRLFSAIPSKYRSAHLAKLLSSCRSGLYDTWDYELNLSQMIERGICLTPEVSYVYNIGFGLDATHTRESRSLDCSRRPWERGFSSCFESRNIELNYHGLSPEVAGSYGISMVKYPFWEITKYLVFLGRQSVARLLRGLCYKRNCICM